MIKKYLAVFLLIAMIQCKPKEKSTAINGVFIGQSHSIYDSETYIGITKLTIKDGVVQNVDFQIVDSLKNEIFDQNYDVHFPDNAEYREQCHKDWQGVLNYPKQLLEKQDLNRVDAVSGATWSYNLFTSSAKVAFCHAGIKISSTKEQKQK